MNSFADERITLTELIGEQEGSPLVSSLGPAGAASRCADALRVSVFRGRAELDELLRREGLAEGKRRQELDGAVVFGRRNVLAGVEPVTGCFSEVDVSEAIDRVG